MNRFNETLFKEHVVNYLLLTNYYLLFCLLLPFLWLHAFVSGDMPSVWHTNLHQTLVIIPSFRFQFPNADFHFVL